MGFCYKCSIFIIILAILLRIGPLIYYSLDQREFNNRTTAEEAAKGNNLKDKIVIVTGSSSGIGISTTKVLVENGAKIIMACRNIEKANKIRNQIITSINKTIDYKEKLVIIKLDLSNLESIDNFVNEFKSKYSSLNILINNAGVGAISEYSMTDNDVEMNFGVNHLGHFYLTQKLTSLLLTTSGISRVINVASLSADIQAPNNMKEWLLSGDKLNNINEYNIWTNYGFSKACNVIYSREYNKRYGNGVNGVYSVSLHPGLIYSDITRDHWVSHNIVCPLASIIGIARSQSQGAATSIRVASISDNEFIKYGGKYFQDCNQADLYRNDLLQDGENSDELGKLLWDLSIKIINEKGFIIESNLKSLPN